MNDSVIDIAGEESTNRSGSVESAKGEAKGKRRLCPHCSENVSRATYFRHKRAFYDSQSKRWTSHAQQSHLRSGDSDSDDAVVSSERNSSRNAHEPDEQICE